MNIQRLKRKLNSHAGETISETLIALLISALALVMLAGAITSAMHMITKSRDKVQDYYAANESASGIVMMTGGTQGNMALTDSQNIINHDPVPVLYFTNTEFDDNPVVAYKFNANPTPVSP